MECLYKKEGIWMRDDWKEENRSLKWVVCGMRDRMFVCVKKEYVEVIERIWLKGRK